MIVQRHSTSTTLVEWFDGCTVPVKSNGTIVTSTKMADCTPSKKVIRNRPGEYLLIHLES